MSRQKTSASDTIMIPDFKRVMKNLAEARQMFADINEYATARKMDSCIMDLERVMDHFTL